ncbi:MAG: HD domain-containing protein [Lachnospiraceae bacterium]|nr:HD domain-containing protein [Lachnospiraceae bacterium]
MNILLSTIVKAAGLPLFINTVGTIVATAIGGSVPGILTAFLTNAVSFFIDSESIFYAPLNMIIALACAAFFGDFANYRKRKKSKSHEGTEGQKRALDIVLFTAALSLIGGIIGSLTTWFLYRSSNETLMIADMSRFFAQRLDFSENGSRFASAILTNVLDKVISVGIAIVIVRAVPDRFKQKARWTSWRQKPLSIEEQMSVRKRLKGGVSIGVRVNIIIILSTLLMTITSLVFGSLRFKESTVDFLLREATQTAEIASGEIEPVMVDLYLKQGESARGYSRVMSRLDALKQSSTDIAFLYVCRYDKEGCHVIFDTGAELGDGTVVPSDPPGAVKDIEEAYLPYIDRFSEGVTIIGTEVENEYGSFYSVMNPVFDHNGKCVCHVVASIEKEIADDMVEQYAGRTALLFLGFLMLIIAISLLTTRYHIVMPILGMTVYAEELTAAGKGSAEESLDKIEKLDIRTGDEVERLYRSFRKMTGNMVDQLNENRTKSEAISKMQSVLLMTMADMVENRDDNAGSHIVKTAAYVRIVLQGLKRNGYYAEKLTDKYMRDVETSAPLHDLGKIRIPDAILNKPGKLTPEEFEIMKSHTTEGKAILDNAISLMDGGNELKEARNMAAYHHERWDGKGYPEGLHGQVIPLSARVMALADVFDAVSSKRVYKESSSFDEAMRTIEEGAGTQFDPKCVEVFLESRDEVKQIYRKYQET